jgi:hypothetical protein
VRWVAPWAVGATTTRAERPPPAFAAAGAAEDALLVVTAEIATASGARPWSSSRRLLLVVAAVVLLVATAAAERASGLPVESGTLITALGALALLLIFYRFLNTPFDLDRRYCLYLGLLFSAGIVAGGRMAMVAADASFSDARSDVGNRVGEIRARPRMRSAARPPATRR